MSFMVIIMKLANRLRRESQPSKIDVLLLSTSRFSGIEVLNRRRGLRG